MMSENMIDEAAHPAGFRLDAYAAGEADRGVEDHLGACSTCRAYVDALGAEAKANAPSAAEANAFVAGLRTRGDRVASPEERVSNNVATLSSRGSLSSRKAMRVVWMASPVLVAAAAIVVLMRTPSEGNRADDTIPTSIPATRFKGRVQIAIVRDRAGDQQRLTTEVPVRAGDRIRAEIGVDDERPILVGVLGKDGSWVVLLAPTLLEAGTTLSPKSARFDNAPTEGWVLAGAPEDVEIAKDKRVFDGVTALPIVTEK